VDAIEDGTLEAALPLEIQAVIAPRGLTEATV
jgi:hypothetical protein